MLTRLFRLSLVRPALLATLLIAPHLSFAEDFYIAQNARGNGSGSSAANARSVEWFNDSSNWSSPTKVPGRIGPGDTVRLTGIVETPLTFRAGGTSGQPITLRFESGARMSHPAWPWSGAIVIDDHDHVVVDGGGHGVIENTANGSPSSFPYQVSSVGTFVNNAHHVSVKDLTIRNLYVRTDKSDKRGGGQSVRVTANSTRGFSNIEILNCTISDSEKGIAVVYRPTPSSKIRMENNHIFNVDDGIFLGDGSNDSSLNDVNISGNRIYGFSKWDEPGSNQFHHDGMHIFALKPGSRLDNIKISNNTIGPDYGIYTTGGIYLSGRIASANIINNILLGHTDSPANGLLTLRPYGNSSINVSNNTFIGNGGSGQAIYLNGADGGRKDVRITNNLATRITFVAVTYSDTWAITADYNMGHALIDRREYSYSTNTTGSFRSFENWQKLGFDTNGLNSEDPLLNAEHQPRAGSPAIGAGVNLLSLFSTDFLGQPRPSSGGWTIGAFEGPRTSATILPSPWQLLSAGEQLEAPWQRVAEGGRQVWQMEGTNQTKTVFLNANNAAWSIIGAADFNGDRRADILWRHQDTGELRTWLMDGGSTTTVESLGMYDPAWQIRAAADFNRDGLVDFVAQNETLAQTQLWLMDGSRLALGVDLGSSTRRWRVAGAGDFDGDGRPDLIWQDADSGDARLTLMQGTVAYHEVLLNGPGSGWRLATIADLNRNGALDLIWQEPSSGRTLYWLMNGVTLGEAIEHPTRNPGWEIVAAADINNDGQVDLLTNALTLSEQMQAPDVAQPSSPSPSAPLLATSASSTSSGGSGGGSWATGPFALIFVGLLAIRLVRKA